MANVKVRLMDKDEDYKKIGTKKGTIEVWEDERRNLNSAKGNWEWWYFDAILDSGVKAVIQFFTKAGMKNMHSKRSEYNTREHQQNFKYYEDKIWLINQVKVIY